jgi:predicted metal-dependent hydrolase
VARPTKTPSARDLTVEIEGRPVPVRLRRHARARRLVLRIDAEDDGVVVTLPPRASAREGLDLVWRQAEWIAGELSALPKRVPFADGAVIPILGVDHALRHAPDRRGVVWIEDGVLWVAGRPEHMARRVADWLKREARRAIAARVAEMAAALDRPFGRIVLRDTVSLWGSCAANGDLSFCWRLILAPSAVLDYVVAHEVAHLANRGHGPRFWRAVERLTPDSEGARAWLGRHGAALHRYG